MNNRISINPAEALTSLGISDSLTLQPIRGGADAAIWRVEHGGESYALRVLRLDQHDQAQREIAAMEAMRASDVPVPRVVTHAIWQDRPVLLIGWVTGRPLIELLLESASDTARIGALGREFGRTQAAIHGVSCPIGSEGVFPPWERWFSLSPDLTESLARTSRRPSALLHLDYHPLNVLVDDERISGVLDWANTRSGDPRADLARTRSIIQLSPSADRLEEAVQRELRSTFEDGWRQGYEEIAGPMGELAPFCWWAGEIMERDLLPRLGQPDLPWLNDDWLARVRQWTAIWREQCQGHD